MYEYLQINIVLSLFAFGVLFLLRTAPSRNKFYVAVVTILISFFPWGSLDVELPVSFAKPFEQFRVRNTLDVNSFVDNNALIEQNFYARKTITQEGQVIENQFFSNASSVWTSKGKIYRLVANSFRARAVCITVFVICNWYSSVFARYLFL